MQPMPAFHSYQSAQPMYGAPAVQYASAPGVTYASHPGMTYAAPVASPARMTYAAPVSTHSMTYAAPATSNVTYGAPQTYAAPAAPAPAHVTDRGLFSGFHNPFASSTAPKPIVIPTGPVIDVKAATIQETPTVAVATAVPVPPAPSPGSSVVQAPIFSPSITTAPAMGNTSLVKPAVDQAAVNAGAPIGDEYMEITNIKVTGGNLGGFGMLDKGDPYVVFNVQGVPQTVKAQTTIKNKNPKPDWTGEIMRLEGFSKTQAMKLEVTIYDSDFGKDDKCGGFTMDLVPVEYKGHTKEKVGKDAYLEFDYSNSWGKRPPPPKKERTNSKKKKTKSSCC